MIVKTVGLYPGAETTPPVMIFVTVGELLVAVVSSTVLTVDDWTSRIGAPRSIYPVAYFSVYFVLILARVL
jgi:hypothetical protein